MKYLKGRLTYHEENGDFGVAGMNEENQDEKIYACIAKLKGKHANTVATLLYRNPLDVLVGNVVILKYGTFEGDSDIVGIPDEEANRLMNRIKEIVNL